MIWGKIHIYCYVTCTLCITQGMLLNAGSPGIFKVQLIPICGKRFSHPIFMWVSVLHMCCVCNFTALDNLDCQNVTHISRSSSGSLSSLPSALSCPSLFPGEAGFGPVPPPHHHPQQQQQQGVAGANIDLGAVYQNTVENRVTRTFSQHWIIVGKHLRLGLHPLSIWS